jgi:hypothetical protein
MKLQPNSEGRFSLDVSGQELTLLNNALNELCNGVYISDQEFATRLGAQKSEAKILLSQISAVLPAQP